MTFETLCNFWTTQKIVVGKHHSKFRTSLATATTSITNSMAMMEWWPSRPQPGILNENSKPLKATLLDWIRLGWDHPIIYILNCINNVFGSVKKVEFSFQTNLGLAIPSAVKKFPWSTAQHLSFEFWWTKTENH